jgi:hypothetical protein
VARPGQFPSADLIHRRPDRLLAGRPRLVSMGAKNGTERLLTEALEQLHHAGQELAAVKDALGAEQGEAILHALM